MILVFSGTQVFYNSFLERIFMSEDEKVISIVEILEEEAREVYTELHNDIEYPIFEGTISSIDGKFESEDVTYSLVSVLTKEWLDRYDNEEIDHDTLTSKMKVARIPFSLDIELFCDTEVITFISDYPEGDSEYTLEILNGEYSGFQYNRPLIKGLIYHGKNSKT